MSVLSAVFLWANLLARRVAKTRIGQRDGLKVIGGQIRCARNRSYTFSVRVNKLAKWKTGFYRRFGAVGLPNPLNELDAEIAGNRISETLAFKISRKPQPGSPYICPHGSSGIAPQL